MDGVVVARVLVHELVAGHAEDDELVLVVGEGVDFLVEGLEAFELRGEAAFGGGVDDEDDFVFEGGEGVGLALFCGGKGGMVNRKVGYRTGRVKAEGEHTVLGLGLEIEEVCCGRHGPGCGER